MTNERLFIGHGLGGLSSDYEFALVFTDPCHQDRRKKIAKALSAYGRPTWTAAHCARFLIEARTLKRGLEQNPHFVDNPEVLTEPAAYGRFQMDAGSLNDLERRMLYYEHQRDERLDELGTEGISPALVIAVRGPRARLTPVHHDSMARIGETTDHLIRIYENSALREMISPKNYRRRNYYTSAGGVAVALLRTTLPTETALRKLEDQHRAQLCALAIAALGHSQITDRQLLGFISKLDPAATGPRTQAIPEAVRGVYEKSGGTPFDPF